MDRRSFLISLSSFSLIPKLYNPPRELEELLNYEEMTIIKGICIEDTVRGEGGEIIPYRRKKVSDRDITDLFRAVKKMRRDWAGIIYVINENILFAHTGDITPIKLSDSPKMIAKWIKFKYIETPILVTSISFKIESIK